MKNVLITGAAGGIGYVLAEEYALAGYNVIAIDINTAKYLHENISFYKVDIKKEYAVRQFFEEINNEYGAIHVLINNGAISSFCKPIEEVTMKEFDDIINVNLRGAVICAKEFINSNSGEDYGRIINIASTRWNQNESHWEAYGASKGALVSFTNSLSISLSQTSITVNAISPGWIQTSGYEELTEMDHKQHPSGRVGKPKDIANLCLFLSEEENDFINGANIVVDGGISKKMIYCE